MLETNSDNHKSAFWKDKSTLIELTAVAFGLVLVILTGIGLLSLR
jgi:hypothetical protein